MCRPIECALSCEHGYIKDSDGCDTCQCVTSSVKSENTASPEVPQSQPDNVNDQSTSDKTGSEDVSQSDSTKAMSDETNQSETDSAVIAKTASLMERLGRYVRG